MDTNRIARFSSKRPMQTLLRMDEHRLVLRTRNSSRVVAIAFAVFGIAMLFGRYEFPNAKPGLNHEAWRYILSGPFLFVGGALWLLPNGAVFDRQRGRLTLRRLLSIRHFPLQQILAVEVIDGGWHDPDDGAAYRTTELTLVLENAFARRLYLTNHADDRVTLAMAREIADFLNIPLRDDVKRDNVQPANNVANASAASVDPSPAIDPENQTHWLSLHGISYLLGFAAAAISVVLSISQAELEKLDAEARPVRARLVAMEVKEWIPGRGNWAPMGTFEIESGDYQGVAEGNLMPPGERRSRRRRIPRNTAAQHLSSWNVGQNYDGYVYPDHPEHIFFALSGAKKNGSRIFWLRSAAGVLFVFGFVTYRLRVWRQASKSRAVDGKADSPKTNSPDGKVRRKSAGRKRRGRSP